MIAHVYSGGRWQHAGVAGMVFLLKQIMKEFEILCGDALEVLTSMESESCQTCITSPPYW